MIAGFPRLLPNFAEGYRERGLEREEREERSNEILPTCPIPHGPYCKPQTLVENGTGQLKVPPGCKEQAALPIQPEI